MVDSELLMRDLLQTVLLFLLTIISPPIISPVASEYHPVPVVKTLVTDPAVSLITTKIEIVSPTAPPSVHLREQLDAILADYPETTIEVVVRSLVAGEHISINGDEPMTAASTAKLLTALMYLDTVERGEKSLDGTIGPYPARSQLEQLIRQSNNDSWDLFISSVGFSKHNRFARDIGMRSYEAKENTMSAEDMAVLLTHIYQRDLLSAQNMDLLMSFMYDTNEERFIPPAVPTGVNVYHKTGILEGYVHDGGIIDDGKNPFILVIFTEHPSQDYDDRVIVFRRITRAVTAVLIPK